MNPLMYEDTNKPCEHCEHEESANYISFSPNLALCRKCGQYFQPRKISPRDRNLPGSIAYSSRKFMEHCTFTYNATLALYRYLQWQQKEKKNNELNESNADAGGFDTNVGCACLPVF